MSRSGPVGPYKRKPLAERFWKHVRKGDGCWEWTASLAGNGYGQMNLGGGPQYGGGKIGRTHRISWELHHGPIPPGMEVCHRCDNRLCVRPDHLFLGSHAENMADMSVKGYHTNRKLTTEQAREIRSLHASGIGHRELARRFGVDKYAIGKIIRGENYKEAA